VLTPIIGVKFVLHHMIDASNANYLMHQWDLNYLLRRYAMPPQSAALDPP